MTLPNRLLFACAAVFAFTATAEAKETTYRKSDRGLLGAMRREGCPSLFLKPTMILSGILESELEWLKEGRPVIVPDNCDAHLLTRAKRIEYRRAKEKIFAGEAALRAARDAENLEKDLHSANETIKQLATDKFNLQVANDKLQGVNDKLQVANDKLLESLKQKGQKAGTSGIVTVVNAIGGAAFMGVAWIMWWVWLKDRAEIAYRDLRVLNGHKKRRFTLVAVKYQCEGHPNQDINHGNILTHLQRSHPEDCEEEGPDDSSLRGKILHVR